MDYWIWMVVAGLGLVAILFFNRQVKVAFTLLRNAVIGAAGIWAANMLLAPIGVMVGVNLMTLFIVGVLGIPGFLLLYLTQWMVG
ncbi:MAG: pro-sigmaK processing inhibitor BofA family protein [Defluviitaleaceae bacterium]|nr:pro-sigmaK processing inhibitor BofA family protein [Defluviitaleaceae bacterium]